jgi:hypothetical protein
MKRSIEWAGGALEALQFVVFVCAAVALVVVGPVVWLYRLFATGRVAWAALVAVLWVGSVLTVAREVRRKAISVVSFGVFLAWLLVLVWVLDG